MTLRDRVNLPDENEKATNFSISFSIYAVEGCIFEQQQLLFIVPVCCKIEYNLRFFLRIRPLR